MHEFEVAASCQPTKLSRLQESVKDIEDHLKRVVQQVSQIMPTASVLAADRQAKELTRLQNSFVIFEEQLERVERQVRQIMAEARKEKEMIQMVPAHGMGVRNDLLVVSQPAKERGRSFDDSNANPAGVALVKRFYDDQVGRMDGENLMNCAGLARGRHPSAKRASSLTAQALVRAESQEKRASSVKIVAGVSN